MRIWLINHYAVPPQYYPLARPSLFAKNLIKMGHDVTIIAASTIHNSDCKNLIEGGAKVEQITHDGIPYILINSKAYRGNGKDRVINILQFAKRLPRVLDTLEKPDAVVATSFDPISCYAGIKYAKKQGIKAIAEIADLWPETLVAYNGLGSNHPIVQYLRRIEKKIYTNADKIVFTMEGAYDYIVEQGWEKEVPREKVAFINNGIDLEQFDYNREHYQIDDEDLKNTDIFKVVYAGAIRKVNNLDKLLDVAERVNNSKVRFLIWGDGDELASLQERKKRESITNVQFKGRVEKKYVPYITSKADLNLAHNDSSPLFRFGVSFNKIFDYLAAGRPILCDFAAKYNPVVQSNAGLSVESGKAEDIAKSIDLISTLDEERKSELACRARKAALQYDFRCLTENLLSLICEK